MNSMIDMSATKTFPAAEALPGAFYAVALSENGLKVAGASDVPLGILVAEVEAAAAGEDVTVQIMGGSRWKLGEAVKAGALLSASGGKAIEAAAGSYVFAQALQNGSADDVIQVQIINGGIKVA